MHGRFFQTRLKSRIADALGVQDNVTRQPRHRNIQSGQEMIVSVGNGLTMMRWGMMPVGPINARGRLEMETIIKARSETVFNKCAFESVGCAVIPVDDWYEWTGEKRRKTSRCIASKDGSPAWPFLLDVNGGRAVNFRPALPKQQPNRIALCGSVTQNR